MAFRNFVFGHCALWNPHSDERIASLQPPNENEKWRRKRCRLLLFLCYSSLFYTFLSAYKISSKNGEATTEKYRICIMNFVLSLNRLKSQVYWDGRARRHWINKSANENEIKKWNGKSSKATKNCHRWSMKTTDRRLHLLNTKYLRFEDLSCGRRRAHLIRRNEFPCLSQR